MNTSTNSIIGAISTQLINVDLGPRLQNLNIINNGNGTYTLNYNLLDFENLESNKEPEIFRVILTSSGDIDNPEVGDILTLSIDGEKYSPNINFDSSTYIFYRADTNSGSGKVEIQNGSNNTYTIQTSDIGKKHIYGRARMNLVTGIGSNLHSDFKSSRMTGATPILIPFGTIQPTAWGIMQDWSIITNTAPNLGTNTVSISVVPGKNNPTKVGDTLIINADIATPTTDGEQLIQIPVGSSNPQTDGEITIFITCRITDTDNAGIILLSNTMYFLMRSGDLLLRATSNGTFGTANNGPSSIFNTYIIRIKPNANNSTVEILNNSGSTLYTLVSGTPNGTVLNDFIIGVTNTNGSTNPASNIELKEIIIFDRGRFEETSLLDAKTYFENKYHT